LNIGASQAGAINFGHPSDVYGGAVSTALQIKNIPTVAGDDIKDGCDVVEGCIEIRAGNELLDPVFLQHL
jgi:hypothetical protein